MVNACGLTANALSGIQLGSVNVANTTIFNNLILNCAVNGASTCGLISTFNGINTYAVYVPGNLFQNNTVMYCTQAYFRTSGSNDTFASNMARASITPYSSNITYASVGSAASINGINLTITGLLNIVQGVNNFPCLSLDWNPQEPFLAEVNSNYIGIYSYSGSELILADSISPSKAQVVAWNQDGTYLVVGTDTGTNDLNVYSWNGTSLTLVQTLPIPNVISLAWHPNGSILAVGTNNGSFDLTLYSWDGSTLSPITSYANAHVAALAWNPAGTILAEGSSDGGNALAIYSLNGVALTLIQYVSIAKIASLAWIPTDGSILAVGSVNGSDDLNMIGYDHGYVFFETIDLKDVTAVAWQYNSSVLAVGSNSGSNDLTIYSWNESTHTVAYLQTIGIANVTALAWGPPYGYFSLAAGTVGFLNLYQYFV